VPEFGADTKNSHELDVELAASGWTAKESSDFQALGELEQQLRAEGGEEEGEEEDSEEEEEEEGEEEESDGEEPQPRVHWDRHEEAAEAEEEEEELEQPQPPPESAGGAAAAAVGAASDGIGRVELGGGAWPRGALASEADADAAAAAEASGQPPAADGADASLAPDAGGPAADEAAEEPAGPPGATPSRAARHRESAEIKERVRREMRKKGSARPTTKGSRNDHKDKEKRKLAANTRNEAAGYSGW